LHAPFAVAVKGDLILAIVNLDQYNQYMSWLPRDEALARLGVRAQTLYAYVSRGLISARPDDNDPRISLYSAADIQHMMRRRRSGRRREAIARQAIAWGDPVMQTRITTVQNGKLFYCGEDAVRLAQHATLEEAAALLWAVPAGSPPPAVFDTGHEGLSLKARAFCFLADAAAQDAPVFGRSRAALGAEAHGLLNGLAGALTGATSRGAFHQRLGRYWKLSPDGMDLLRRALVLVADHELNPSTFAARVAASTGAPLAACALAGLSTLAGPLHGEASARALSYLKQAQRESPQAALKALASRQEKIPATGHALYPSGDPRAGALLRWMKAGASLKLAIQAAEKESSEAANIDMALAALTQSLSLPDDAPFVIFACGRMAGWLAHSIEQAESGLPIRPRATYTGPIKT
jgi:citrate synthase